VAVQFTLYAYVPPEYGIERNQLAAPEHDGECGFCVTEICAALPGALAGNTRTTLVSVVTPVFSGKVMLQLAVEQLDSTVLFNDQT
jgi:hypothetical protein